MNYGQSRPDMQQDCPERVNRAYWHFLKWVVGYKRRKESGRCAAIEALQSAPDSVAKIHLRSRREVDVYLKHVASSVD